VRAAGAAPRARARRAPRGDLGRGAVVRSTQDALWALLAAADVRAAVRLFQRRTEDVARRHGLTPQRHALLLMIKGAPHGSERSTVTAFAERLQLAQSTVTELVARAEGLGLIARETDRHDARVSHLRLTPEASRRLAATAAVLARERERLEKVLARLGAERTQGEPSPKPDVPPAVPLSDHGTGDSAPRP
jgi:DNA-binding MarR family transcriptional regulator